MCLNSLCCDLKNKELTEKMFRTFGKNVWKPSSEALLSKLKGRRTSLIHDDYDDEGDNDSDDSDSGDEDIDYNDNDLDDDDSDDYNNNSNYSVVVVVVLVAVVVVVVVVLVVVELQHFVYSNTEKWSKVGFI